MTVLTRILCSFILLAVAAPVAFAAPDRMAGRIPGAEDNNDTTGTKNPAADDDSDSKDSTKDLKRVNSNNVVIKTPVVNTPQPRTGKTMDRKSMESLGPLTNPLKGSLGDDMWTGSSRSVAQDFIPQLPNGDTLPAVQILARRVLLSNGDVDLLKSDKQPEAGHDLFTLRVKKLLEIGAYADAVNLYTLIEGEPGYEQLARAGVMALMFDGYPAQACLEVKAAHKVGDKSASESDNFWPQIEAVCNYVQADSLKSIKGSTKEDTAPALPPVTGIPGSKILTTLVSRADYRHNVSSADDLEELSEMERAVLRGMGRIDYSRLKIKKIETIPSTILMMMAGDPNLPPEARLTLYIEATNRGLITADGLGAFYTDTAKKTEAAGPNTEPSNSIFGRFVAASKPDAAGSERNNIVSTLLESHSRDDRPTILLPFADMVPAINPDKLSARAVRTGLILMLQDGLSPPERWVKAWLKGESDDSRKSVEDLRLYLANLVSENLPTESATFPDDALKPLFPDKETAESLDIYASFAGLGQEKMLEKAVSRDVYEKHIDLTLTNDYVMPVGGLIDKLREAAQSNRLGETALLAAVALKDYDPAKTHPGVIREVIKGLETVGLKEEARNIALCVVLGFNNK